VVVQYCENSPLLTGQGVTFQRQQHFCGSLERIILVSAQSTLSAAEHRALQRLTDQTGKVCRAAAMLAVLHVTEDLYFCVSNLADFEL